MDNDDTPTTAEVLEPPQTVIDSLDRAETETAKQYWQRMYDRWVKGFTDREEREEFFEHVSTVDIINMLRLDPTNPLTMLDSLDGMVSTRKIPATPALGAILREYRDNKPVFVEEIVRAVKRGKLTPVKKG